MLETYLPTDATFEEINEIANYTNIIRVYTLTNKNYAAFYKSKMLAQRSPNKDGSIQLKIHMESVYINRQNKELTQLKDLAAREIIIDI